LLSLGSSTTRKLTGGPDGSDPSHRSVVVTASALVAVALLAGCGYGDDDEAKSTTTTGAATWSGPPRPAEDGTISVEGFNEYAESLPESERLPKPLAVEFLRPREPYDVSAKMRTGGATVYVLRENLEDDSVRAERHQLGFGLVSGGRWRLLTAQVAYQCQLDRGHQDFSAELCL
jgi:hypothetical protein